MTLLLDVGNTRVKAALLSGGELRGWGSAAWRDGGLAEGLDGLDLPPADRAVACVVAGPGVRAALEEWAAGRGLALEVIRPGAEAAGVRCGYPEPARLGSDRWAALVGARALTSHRCLVVDAGSALTVDAMAADGRHLGGFIIPGLALMAGALRRETGDLDAFSAASREALRDGFAVDTRPAIEEGARLAAAGLVREAVARLPGEGPAEILLTGGDAAGLAALIPGARQVPDLVLRGLARLA